MSERTLDIVLPLPRRPETAAEFTVDRIALVAAFFREAVNEGDMNIINEMAHPDIRDLSDDRLFDDGIRGLRFAVERLRLVMPDIYCRILRIRHAAGDAVDMEVTFTGTYRGGGLTATERHGRQASWRQQHRWSFLGPRVLVHQARVDKAAIRAGLGDPY